MEIPLRKKLSTRAKALVPFYRMTHRLSDLDKADLVEYTSRELDQEKSADFILRNCNLPPSTSLNPAEAWA